MPMSTVLVPKQITITRIGTGAKVTSYPIYICSVPGMMLQGIPTGTKMTTDAVSSKMTFGNISFVHLSTGRSLN